MASKPDSKPKTFSADTLNEDEVASVLRKVLAYVRWRVRCLGGWVSGPDNLGHGQECEDIAIEVVTAFCLNDRQWSSMLEVMAQLRSDANSKIINLREKLGRHHRLSVNLVRDNDVAPDGPEEARAFDDFTRELEEAILEREDEHLMNLYVMALADDDIAPAAIEAKFGISKREADGLKRKLRTIVNDVRERLGLTKVRPTRGAAR